MHFTYASKLDNKSLMQGDVLKRTPAIDVLLNEVHPHFFRNSKNQFFMILTQSCDLVRRDGIACKSPYITIAPVRTMDEVLNRQVNALKSSALQTELPVLTDKGKSKLSEFLHRLYNNNEPGYFFLESENTTLPSDCCTFLNLSIAIKSEYHYDKCLDAKVLELEPSFQAKLGWLVGQLFSRVGTTDWPKETLNSKVNAALKDVAIWVPDSKLKLLIERAPEGAPISAPEIKNILRHIPDRKKQVLERTSEIISELINTDNEDQLKLAEKLKKRLENDLTLKALLH